MPSCAAVWKFSSAALKDICVHIGRSLSASERTSPK